jgi:BRCA1 C Terminus (BRCT) domain
MTNLYNFAVNSLKYSPEYFNGVISELARTNNFDMIEGLALVELFYDDPDIQHKPAFMKKMLKMTKVIGEFEEPEIDIMSTDDSWTSSSISESSESDQSSESSLSDTEFELRKTDTFRLPSDTWKNKYNYSTFAGRVNLKGLEFVFTGDLENFGRTEVTRLIQNLGGVVKGYITKNTSFLVLGKNPGKTKLSRANAYRDQIVFLTESELLEKVLKKEPSFHQQVVYELEKLQKKDESELHKELSPLQKAKLSEHEPSFQEQLVQELEKLQKDQFLKIDVSILPKLRVFEKWGPIDHTGEEIYFDILATQATTSNWKAMSRTIVRDILKLNYTFQEPDLKIKTLQDLLVEQKRKIQDSSDVKKDFSVFIDTVGQIQDYNDLNKEIISRIEERKRIKQQRKEALNELVNLDMFYWDLIV